MRLPILCYHKVGSIAEEGRRLNIEPPRLETHVRYFKRRGFSFVLPGDGMFVPRAVCFTFDDAYASALKHALPVFERHGGRCAFFAVTSLVGGVSSWDGELARPLASWEELEHAHTSGFMIGNHTHTHPRLPGLSAEQQEEEVLAAKQVLSQRGLDGPAFCYPYGSLDRTAQAAAGRHYAYAVALGKRQARQEDDVLALPRIVVAYSDALPKLLYKIHIRPTLP